MLFSSTHNLTRRKDVRSRGTLYSDVSLVTLTTATFNDFYFLAELARYALLPFLAFIRMDFLNFRRAVKCQGKIRAGFLLFFFHVSHRCPSLSKFAGTLQDVSSDIVLFRSSLLSFRYGAFSTMGGMCEGSAGYVSE